MCPRPRCHATHGAHAHLLGRRHGVQCVLWARKSKSMSSWIRTCEQLELPRSGLVRGPKRPKVSVTLP
jgi:hypothetical protein